MALYDDLNAKINFVNDPAWADADKIERVLMATANISSAVLDVYRALRGTPVEQDELSRAIELVYATHVAPLDIPGVGPVIESIIDQQAARVLGASVKALDAFLDKRGV